ncbi:hypothetical protein B0H14DRAFT_3562282 [Mycena olivaceomarginata]|nr:hypothetical protein B0H14DRAFT_3562282 [Mycena olivaceomarginata]
MPTAKQTLTTLRIQAALALRSLCDANRRALAARISAFAEVHAGLGGVPDSEKWKVLQSIASVIQALPPAEGVAPVEALIMPGTFDVAVPPLPLRSARRAKGAKPKPKPRVEARWEWTCPVAGVREGAWE